MKSILLSAFIIFITNTLFSEEMIHCQAYNHMFDKSMNIKLYQEAQDRYLQVDEVIIPISKSISVKINDPQKMFQCHESIENDQFDDCQKKVLSHYNLEEIDALTSLSLMYLFDKKNPAAIKSIPNELKLSYQMDLKQVRMVKKYFISEGEEKGVLGAPGLLIFYNKLGEKMGVAFQAISVSECIEIK